MRHLVLVLLLAAPAAAADLTHSSDSGSFRIKFPAPPETEEKELRVGAGQTVPMATHKATDPKSGAVFSVTVAEYPLAFTEVSPDLILDGARDGLKGKDGKVKAEETMKGPHPGRAVRIEAGRNIVRTRLVLVGRKLYQVTVIGPSKTFPEKLSDQFFAAFEPTPR